MNSLYELAREWLDGFDKDPRRVVYERLYTNIYRRFVAWQDGYDQRPKMRMLDVGSGYGNTIMIFASLPWKIVAIERYLEIAERLKERLTEAEGIDFEIYIGDIQDFYAEWQGGLRMRFDLATMILTTQYMDPEQLRRSLTFLSYMTNHLLLDVTNRNSLYGLWTMIRGWKSPNAYYYTPREIESMLVEAGFRINYTVGVGFLSPLSLRKGFKSTVIRPWMTAMTWFLDRMFPRRCHLYYLECTSVVNKTEGEKP